MQTLESFHRRAIERSRQSPLAFVAKRWCHGPVDWPAINSGETDGEVEVRANHGQWQADCPMVGCGGSMLVSDNDPRFLCPTCGSVPMKVVWPADREAIEAALMVRPEANRNYEPGETVADLLAENTEHEVG